MATTTTTTTRLHDDTRRLFSLTQSLSFEASEAGRPITVVRGEKCYLIDDRGVRYLDLRNNVASVGHQDPVFVNEVAEQMRATNTNARYLHPKRVELAEQLLALFPHDAQLRRVFLVNSGSEANDLALRLARAYARSPNYRVAAMRNAYHGVTMATMEASPYKWKGKPIAPSLMVLDYLNPEETLTRVREVMSGVKPTCLLMEAVQSVAGIVFPPDTPAGWVGDLAREFQNNRRAVICDEVQTGLGRLGECVWGFELLGLHPDIVTIGKGAAGGFPFGAVVCTEEINEAIEAEGREVFFTYGGNPVACVAALHVLRRVTGELQPRCRRLGRYFGQRLREVIDDANDAIRDVRGMGLMWGIAFRDETTATAVLRRLKREHRVVASSEEEVLVVKPPMIITEEQLDYFLAVLMESVRYVTMRSLL